MKILVITDGITPFVVGGMQKHSHGLIKYLVLSGHEVTMIHALHSGMVRPSDSEVKTAMGLSDSPLLKVKTLYFPPKGIFPGHYLKSSYQFSIKAFETIENELNTFDFIYAKGFTGWHFIAKKVKGEKMPPIGVNFHGYEMFQRGGSISMKLKKYLLKGPVKWISVNADFVFSYGSKITSVIKSIGVYQKRILEIPTGIESSWLENQKLRESDFRRFLFIGRYERRKGIEELMEVIKQRAIKDDVEFHFIGPIEHSKRILRKDVIYHGEIKEAERVIGIMDTCHVLLCPSHSEGMPNVIIEGMSRGMAVIATDVGAVDCLVDENTGWLIGPGDVAALKDTIARSEELSSVAVQEMGKMAIQKVKNQFLWERIIDLTVKLIDRTNPNT